MVGPDHGLDSQVTVNRDILDTTKSFLADLDDVLQDFGAKRAFENLFPLHEGDDEIGEMYQEMGFISSHLRHGNGSQTSNGRCYPAPPLFGLDEEPPEHCSECWEIHLLNWARTISDGNRSYLADEQAHYGFMSRIMQDDLPLDRPFMLTNNQIYCVQDALAPRPELQEPVPDADRIAQEVHKTLLFSSPWNADAFLYSLEFFGPEHFMFETAYGNEAMKLEDILGACI
jgi:hypothetical protein